LRRLPGRGDLSYDSLIRIKREEPVPKHDSRRYKEGTQKTKIPVPYPVRADIAVKTEVAEPQTEQCPKNPLFEKHREKRRDLASQSSGNNVFSFLHKGRVARGRGSFFSLRFFLFS